MTSGTSFAEQVFAHLRAETDWNIDGPMLWGYVFIDSDPDRLEALAAHLHGEGYQPLDIRPQVDDDTAIQCLALHVERVETHSPSSLEARNLDFKALAETFGVAGYDGIDVGPTPDAQTADSDA